VEVGSQLQVTVEAWMMKELKMERICGLSQLYRLRDPKGNICLLVAKVTDDFLFAGTHQALQLFSKHAKDIFEIRNVFFDDKLLFNGAEIS